LPVAVGPTIATSRERALIGDCRVASGDSIPEPDERVDRQDGQGEEEPDLLRAGRCHCEPPPGGVSLK
jgi:hypothetical protein